MSQVLDEHRSYLADRARVDTFAAAIAAVVRPGDVVIDLGAGTGILGLLACRAGASRVYAIDATPTIELARVVAVANGVSDRITFVRGRSTRVQLPERADVVVGDQLGAFGYGAGVLEYFADARARLLKPEGRTVPSSISLMVAPVESEACRERVRFWRQPIAGFRFDAVAAVAANTAHTVTLLPGDVLGPAICGASIACDTPPDAISVTADVEVTRSGELHGVAGWFEAVLAPGIVVTNDPRAAGRIDRAQLFYPIDPPCRVSDRHRVEIAMTIRPADQVVAWRVNVSDAQGTHRHSVSHSSFAGMLLGGGDVRRSARTARPRLGAWAAARRDVLGLCDGLRPLAAIERELASRHGALFPTEEDAARFVAEVLGHDIDG